MADLTLTITEAVTLNGSARGSTNTKTVAGINHVMHRIVTCPVGQSTTVAVFNTNTYSAAGAIDTENVRHIRITNLDSSNAVFLGLVGASDNYQIELSAGMSHMLPGANGVMLGEEDTTPAFASLESLVSIVCRPTASATVQVEIFVASV